MDEEKDRKRFEKIFKSLLNNDWTTDEEDELDELEERYRAERDNNMSFASGIALDVGMYGMTDKNKKWVEEWLKTNKDVK